MTVAEKKFNVWAFFKANIGSIVLTLYIVGSLLYILLNFYSNIIVAYGNNAYLQWQQQTIIGIAQEVSKAQCKPFPLQLGQQGTLGLVDANCLGKTEPIPAPTK